MSDARSDMEDLYPDDQFLPPKMPGVFPPVSDLHAAQGMMMDVNRAINEMVRATLRAQQERTETMLVGVFGTVEGMKREMRNCPVHLCYESGKATDDPTLRMTHLCLRCHLDYVGEPITTAEQLAFAKETYASGYCQPCTVWRERQGERV